MSERDRKKSLRSLCLTFASEEEEFFGEGGEDVAAVGSNCC